jgi:hypothetical protein
MTFMDEVGVIAMLHRQMSAARRVAVRMILGDGVRGRQLVIVGQLREYGHGVTPAQQVGERSTQHEDRDGK